MKFKLILIISLIALSITSCGFNSGSAIDRRIRQVEGGLLGEFGDPPWKRMDLQDRMAHYNVPGVSIVVINDFKVEWKKGYGVMEAGKSQPVTPETLFQTGSIGKPVVAVAALKFVEAGVLDLDGDVNQHLVSWQIPQNEFNSNQKVTLRRLLSHNAGVTVEGFRGYAQGEKVPDLQQILNGEPPANSAPIRVDIIPGTQYRYSGGGYMIVQQLLEDVADESLPEIMQNVVLDSWGMKASSFRSPLPEALESSAGVGHRADGSPIPGGWHTYPEIGSGASMWSTVTDLAQFSIKVMQSYTGQSDDVLSHNMATQMLTPQVDTRGLGPVVQDDGGDRFYFWHPGSNDGYKAILVAYPDRGQGCVIMTNGDKGDALYSEILHSISIEYYWIKDNTNLYLGITLFLALSILVALYLLRKKEKRNSHLTYS